MYSERKEKLLYPETHSLPWYKTNFQKAYLVISMFLFCDVQTTVKHRKESVELIKIVWLSGYTVEQFLLRVLFID